MIQRQKSATSAAQKRKFPIGLVTGVLVALVAIGALFAWMFAGTSPSDVPEERARAGKIIRNRGKYRAISAKEAVRAAMPKNLPKRTREATPIKKKVVNLDIFSHLKGADKKMAEAVQAALDNDDWEGTRRAAERALTSENAEVRQNAVDALAWFGAEALPELTACMADPDEDVAQSAMNAWELALQEIPTSQEQFPIAAAAFATISDEDELTMLGSILTAAATDLVDGAEGEEEAGELRVEIIQSLVDIIEGDRPKNSAAAKEAYEDFTGNEWRGLDEAERYLQDPENYELPEDRTDESAEQQSADQGSAPQGGEGAAGETSDDGEAQADETAPADVQS